MNNLMAADWYKLRRNGVFHILCYYMVVAASLYILVIYLSSPKAGGHEISLTGIKLYVNALTLNQLFIKLSVGILAGFFIALEYASGVLKRTAAIGNSRKQIYLAKLWIYALGMVLVSLLIPIIALVIGGLMSGFGLLSGFGQPSEIATLEYILRTLGFTVLFAAAFASIAAFIAVILTDNGKTIGFSLLFFLFIDQIFMVLGGYVPWIKVMYDYSLFKLFTATLAFKMDHSDVLSSIIMPIATFVVFAILGMGIFREKEIQ